MKVCIITLAQFIEGAEKIYNLQDIGLGRGFAELGHETEVIRLEKRSTLLSVEKYNELLTIKHCKVTSLGGNSLGIGKFLPKEADIMICFSDIQLSFREVKHHCQIYGIKLIPYIGTIESHSGNLIIRILRNFLSHYNINVYKKVPVCAKTVDVKNKLNMLGIRNVTVAPVCLDRAQFVSDISPEDRENLRKYILPSYLQGVKCLLFVGRLSEEKRPMEALRLFHTLYLHDKNYRLIIIGKGHLKDSVAKYLDENGLNDVAVMRENIPNKDMWMYYSAADCSLNLNRVEIFGMSILEAMYYECPVVAYAAPGPQMIITNGLDGYLFDDVNKAASLIGYAISNGRLKAAKVTVQDRFVWSNTASKMLEIAANL